MEFLSLPSRKERGETAVFTGCETCKVFGFNAIKYSLLLLLLQSKKKTIKLRVLNVIREYYLKWIYRCL